MKFTERMQSAINEQINFEMFSANTYLSMSAYFAQQGLDGFAHWFFQQYREELEHAEDMMRYVITRGGRVEIKAVDAVETNFSSALEIAEKTYAHDASQPKRRTCLLRTSSGSTSVSRSKKKLTLRPSSIASVSAKDIRSSSWIRNWESASSPPGLAPRDIELPSYPFAGELGSSFHFPSVLHPHFPPFHG